VVEEDEDGEEDVKVESDSSAYKVQMANRSPRLFTRNQRCCSFGVSYFIFLAAIAEGSEVLKSLKVTAWFSSLRKRLHEIERPKYLRII